MLKISYRISKLLVEMMTMNTMMMAMKKVDTTKTMMMKTMMMKTMRMITTKTTMMMMTIKKIQMSIISQQLNEWRVPE